MNGTVMTHRIRRQIYVAFIVVFIITCVYSEPITRSLCEGRCETSIPHLRILKNFWLKMSKPLGILVSKDISFETFVRLLVMASERYPRLMPIRDNVLRMIYRYHDCTKACEHQHSKRTFQMSIDQKSVFKRGSVLYVI